MLTRAKVRTILGGEGLRAISTSVSRPPRQAVVIVIVRDGVKQAVPFVPPVVQTELHQGAEV